MTLKLIEVKKIKSMNDNNSSSDRFKEFQLKEYENVAKAHHETVNQVSVFFRYYLIIISTPSVFLAFITKLDFQIPTNFIFIKIITLIFLVLSIIGFCLFIFIVNLRTDAILYARTVNGIRNFFYENSELKNLSDLKYRVLPTNTTKPKYFEKSHFLSVIFTFSIINSLYFILSIYLLYEYQNLFIEKSLIFHITSNKILYISFISLFIICNFIHIKLYKYLSWRKENFYLKSNKIGIEIGRAHV